MHFESGKVEWMSHRGGVRFGKLWCYWLFSQGLLENGQDTDRQNFYFLYLTENENLALISFEDL